MKHKKIIIFILLAIFFASVICFCVISGKKNGTDFIELDGLEIVLNISGQTVRYPADVFKLSPAHDEIPFDNHVKMASIHTEGERKELRVVIRVPRNEYDRLSAENKKKVFSEVYRQFPVDWDIDYCGEMFHVRNWKYSGQEIDRILSGPGWSVLVTRCKPSDSRFVITANN